jgi:hypothetical protein
MTAPAATAPTAGHGLLRSLSPRPSTTSLPPDRRGRLRNGAQPGDFLAAPRCGAQTRAGGCCRQPAMKNGRCPDAWRAEHRTAHRRGPRPLRRRPPEARLLFRRDGRPAPLRRCSLPPYGCVLRRAEGPAHRWAWAPSAESREPLRRQGPDLADQRTGRSTLHILRVSASPRWIFQRPRRVHRWAWGPSAGFAGPASSSGNDGPARPPICGGRRSLVISCHLPRNRTPS